MGGGDAFRVLRAYPSAIARVLRDHGLRGLLRVIARTGREMARGDFHALRPWPGTDPQAPHASVRLLKPIDVVVTDRAFAAAEAPRCAVVCTVRDEGERAARLCADLERQTVRPAEIALVDGGSRDGTVAVLEEFAARYPGSVRVLAGGELNIAQGRNRGVAATTAGIVVFVDAGCRLPPNLVADLTAALPALDADLAAAVTVPVPAEHAAWFAPDWRTFRGWDGHLPSARAVAVRRALFEQAGGFPEFLTRTGEDTLFAVRYRRWSRRWVFHRGVQVEWDAPPTRDAALVRLREYAAGDGESGIGDFAFRADEAPAADTPRSAFVAGYREGRARRPRIEVERRGVRDVVVILSGVPLTDVGGGQRATQLALELVHQGRKVVFVNEHDRHGDQVERVWFDVDYSLLELVARRAFDPDDLAGRYAPLGARLLVITEFPHPRFVPLVAALRRAWPGATYAFDAIDLWDSSLGGDWYDRRIEQELLDGADLRLASAATLREAFAARTTGPVELVANAVNARVFDAGVCHARPADLPPGEYALYVGSLYGEWFDWDAVEAALAADRERSIVFIGDHRAARRAAGVARRHRNARFLGPRAQTELPAYLQHARAGLIPFRTDRALTRFVNPLKVYEYLAMHRPVVATAMPELAAIPGVSCARDPAGFAAALLAAREPGEAERRAIAAFVAEHCWSARVARILALWGTAAGTGDSVGPPPAT